MIAIYYAAIFLNYQSILKDLPGQVLPIVGVSLIFIVPLGVKGGIILHNKTKKANLFLSILSITVVVGFSLFTIFHSDLSIVLHKFVHNGYWEKYHRSIIGLVILLFVYFVYFALLDLLNIETFIESIKNFPLVTPVFCFGAPPFWKKSLSILHISDSEISFLGSISFVSGIIFLIALLLYFVAKSLNPPRISPFNEVNDNKNQRDLYKVSLAFTFAGIAALLFVCLDICLTISAN